MEKKPKIKALVNIKQKQHKEVQPPVKEYRISKSAINYLDYEIKDMTVSTVQKTISELTKDIFEPCKIPVGKTCIWNLILDPDESLNGLFESLKPYKNKEEENFHLGKVAALILRCKRVKFKLYVIDRLLFQDPSLSAKALKTHFKNVCEESKSQLVHLDLKTAPKNEVLSNFTSESTFRIITTKLITFESYLKDLIPGLCEANNIPRASLNGFLPSNVHQALINIAPLNLKGKTPDYYIVFRYLLNPPSNLDSEQKKQWNSYEKEFRYIASFWIYSSEPLELEYFFPRDFHIEETFEQIASMPVISKALFSKIINTFTKLSPRLWLASLTIYLQHLKKKQEHKV